MNTKSNFKRIPFVLALAAGAFIGSAFASSSDAFLEGKKKEWLATAIPVSKTPFIVDSKGCLYGLVDSSTGPTVIAILGDDKKPVCKPN